ncbi:hypothetical protein B0H14DRAFT_3449504 [Mycena olivaceomarginata]|nr:hypothetical protein B0H14DRAFT_3449504 [Mycena olivaceomarginata]
MAKAPWLEGEAASGRQRLAARASADGGSARHSLRGRPRRVGEARLLYHDIRSPSPISTSQYAKGRTTGVGTPLIGLVLIPGYADGDVARP